MKELVVFILFKASNSPELEYNDINDSYLNDISLTHIIRLCQAIHKLSVESIPTPATQMEQYYD